MYDGNRTIIIVEENSMNKLIQKAAHYLYDLGFNVMPIPIVSMFFGGKKPPYGRFIDLFHCRLSRAYINQLFMDSNLAVLCGTQSNNLFVIDCDSHSAFEGVRSNLKQDKIETWSAKSERGGHFWFLSKEGEVNNISPTTDIDVIGNRQYIVAPPSIHPTGQIYEWETRSGKLPTLISPVFLGEILEIELKPIIKNNNNITSRVLVEKNSEGYKSNSEAEFAAVLSLIRANYSDDMIVEIFEKYKPPHYSSKRDSEQWLEKHMIRPAREEIGLSQGQLNNIDIYDIQWPINTGETDKRVFKALCERKLMDKRTDFRASVREVAEQANVHRNTVSRSMRRLCDRGLIVRKGLDYQSKAYRYEIVHNFKEQKL